MLERTVLWPTRSAQGPVGGLARVGWGQHMLGLLKLCLYMRGLSGAAVVLLLH